MGKMDQIGQQQQKQGSNSSSQHQPAPALSQQSGTETRHATGNNKARSKTTEPIATGSAQGYSNGEQTF